MPISEYACDRCRKIFQFFVDGERDIPRNPIAFRALARSRATSFLPCSRFGSHCRWSGKPRPSTG